MGQVTNSIRTIDEIVAYCKQNDSVFSFGPTAVLEFLTFEQAKPFLTETTEETRQVWNAITKPLTREAIIAVMRDYMEFAWGKVDGHRGLSASRSVEKMAAWVWLLGDDDTSRKMEAAPYVQYGAPKLAVVCREYGFPIPSTPGIERMISGLPCVEGCEEGCGE